MISGPDLARELAAFERRVAAFAAFRDQFLKEKGIKL